MSRRPTRPVVVTEVVSGVWGFNNGG
jgi:hypothetical protein